MKEEILIHNKKKNPKGSVLFTVVAVMMVMIVFVLATLTIAGAANKRAYASYSKNQTTYTAQAALQATIKAMKDVNDANSIKIATKINGLSENASTSFSVVVDNNDSDVARSMGSTVITAKNIGTTNQIDTSNGVSTPKTIIELSATTTLGDESSTVSNYYVIDPVNIDDTTNPTGAKSAVTVMGNVNTSYSVSAFGGSAISLNKSRWQSTITKKVGDDDVVYPAPNNNNYIYTLYQNNNNKTSSDIVSNGSLVVKSALNSTLYKGQGISVFGDLYFDNSSIAINSAVDLSSKYTGDDGNEYFTYSYDDIPYIYVERAFFAYDAGTFGAPGKPINLYCGGTFYQNRNAFTIYGDVYVYNHDFSVEAEDYSDFDLKNVFTSSSKKINLAQQCVCDTTPNVSVIYGNGGGTHLISWARQLVEGGSSESIGGNFYTQGSLETRDAAVIIDGDCYVKENMVVNGNTTIKGNLTVEGTLTVNSNLTVNGKIYCANYADDGEYGLTTQFKSNNASKISGSATVEFPSDKTLDKILQLDSTQGSSMVSTGEAILSQYMEDDGSEYKKSVYLTSIPSTIDTEISKTVYSQSGENQLIYVGDGKGDYTKIKCSDEWNTWYETKYVGENNGNLKYQATTALNGKDITEGCVLAGTISNLKICPGDSDIWIKLSNVTVQGTIEVDNSGSGNVYFYIPDGCSLNLNGGKIVTSTYASGVPSTLHETYTKAEKQYIPNIYIYSGKNGCSINESNNNLVTAYIYAPYADITVNNGIDGDYKVSTYIDADGISHTPTNQGTGFIGSIIVNDLKLSNLTNFYYVQNTPTDLTLDDKKDSDSSIDKTADGKYIQWIGNYQNG